MSTSTFRRSFLLISWHIPRQPNIMQISTGTSPSQSVMVYSCIWTPVSPWNQLFNAAKPTAVPSGPTGCTSTVLISTVQTANRAISSIPVQKNRFSFGFINFVLSPIFHPDPIREMIFCKETRCIIDDTNRVTDCHTGKQKKNGSAASLLERAMVYLRQKFIKGVFL